VTSKSEMTKPKQGISRRTVVAGTAWAVPAIVVASAAPAMAASGPVVLSGTACKGPGQSGNFAFAYYFQVTLTNNTNSSQTYTFNSITINGSQPPLTSIAPSSVTVNAQTVTVVTLLAQGSTNSANGTAVLAYMIGGVPGTTQATIADFPPIQGAQCQLTYPSRTDTPITP
jgi:hypothetical protein